MPRQTGGVQVSVQMTWEQKFAAIMSVAPSAEICMRKPGNWYVHANMMHASGSCCLVGNYGNGATPEAAVEDHWSQYGDGQPFFVNDEWLMWNGFMFEKSERPCPAKPAA